MNKYSLGKPLSKKAIKDTNEENSTFLTAPQIDGDGYKIAIKNTFTLTGYNYVTLAITDPNGIEKCTTIPICSIEKQLVKGLKTYKHSSENTPNV